MSNQPRPRIRVPTRMVQGGLDYKFDTSSRGVNLHGILSPEEYKDAMVQINQRIRPARCNQIDGALLVTGPLLVPLALWGVRHRLQTRRRRRLLTEAIEEFNETHPDHLMQWHRGGAVSLLTIEWRQNEPQQGHPVVPAVHPNSQGTMADSRQQNWWQREGELAPFPSVQGATDSERMVAAESRLVV